MRENNTKRRCWPSLITPRSNALVEEGQHQRQMGASHLKLDLDQGNGKRQSDMIQVIGRKLLVGQLAAWVAWDI